VGAVDAAHRRPGSQIAEDAGAPFLVIRDAEGAEHIQILDGTRAPVTMGRVAKADISLEWDGEVSRLHARLEPIGSEWTIVDDGLSTNGTFLNGRRIVGRQRLIDGDALRLGRSHLTFRHPAQERAASTVRAGRLPAVAELSATNRRILVALCRPLTQPGDTDIPATDEEIGAEVGLGVGSVKAHLRFLCRRFDIDDLPQSDKRARLAELALELDVVAHREP
jgi:pSer/pThr/pTyr-binding forkhead associated (FHA) protein